MDLPSINNTKINHQKVEVHELPQGEQAIHAEYGLRILFTIRDKTSPPTELSQPRYFEFYGFSHLTSGKGWYWTPKGIQTFEAGHGVISTPSFLQSYGGHHSTFTEDALGFAGPIADCLFKSGLLRDGIIEVGRMRRLLPIIELASDPSVTSQLRANIALQELLIQLHLENASKSHTLNDHHLHHLLSEMSKFPRKWWTVHEMAELCHLSQSQFRRVFLSNTGYAPKKYIDQMKIQKAGERLCSCRESIATVAKEFGYRDEYHFSRRFKAVTHLTPSQFRNQYSLSG